MSDKKKDVEPFIPFSERPTDAPPRMVKAETHEQAIKPESITLGKIFGMTLNDDSYLERVSEDGCAGLFAVADGIGGEAGGDIASQTTVEILDKYEPAMDAIRRRREAGDASASIESEAEVLRKAIREANARIRLMREEMEKFPRMGTTCVALRLTRDAEKNHVGIVAHAGDSRAYLQHPDGRLETLTLDDHGALLIAKHKFGEEAAMRIQHVLDNAMGEQQLEHLMKQVKEGREMSESLPFTTEDIRFFASHFERGLFNYYFERPSEVAGSIGNMPDIHTKIVPALPGSKFVLASDGIDGLMHDELEKIVAGRYDELPYEGIRDAVLAFGGRTAEAIAFAAKERQDETRPPRLHPRSRGPDDTTVQVIPVPKRRP